MTILGLLACLVSVANVYLVYEVLFADPGYISMMSSHGGKIVMTIITILVGIIYFLFLGYLVYLPVTVTECTIDEEEKEPLIPGDQLP